MEKEKPSYYGILPACVRYDESVCPMAKVLYTEFTALTQKDGICRATNAYFARLYNVAPTTVSEWVKQLADAGYIQVSIDASHGNKRRIKVAPPLRKKAKTSSGKGEELNTTSRVLQDKEKPAVPAVVGIEQSLHRSVQRAFESKQGVLSDYGKEGAAIKGLIKKATASFPDDPASFLMRLLDEFWSMKQGGNVFWASQPFTPSTLNASGIYDRVCERLRASVPVDAGTKAALAEVFK